MSNIKPYTKIEYRSRNYHSTTDTSKQSPRESLSSSLLNQVEKWTEPHDQSPDDQICLIRLTERGVKEVVSTGVTKEMLEKFINKEKLSNEHKAAIQGVLGQAIDQDLSNADEEKLQFISNLILQAPDNLDFIKHLSAVPNDQLKVLKQALQLYPDDLPQIIADLKPHVLDKILQSWWALETLGLYPDILPEAMNKLNPDLLDKMISQNNAEIFEALGDYPDALPLAINELKPDRLDRILQSSGALQGLGRHPDTLPKIINGLSLDLLDKLIKSQSLEVLVKYSHLLLNVKIAPFREQILSSDPTRILKALGEDADLLVKMPLELLGQILSSSDPAEVLKTLSENQNLLEKIKPELFSQILSSKDPSGVLNALKEEDNPFEKIPPKLFNQILSSNDPAGALNTLREDGDFIEKIPPELFDQILSSSDPTGVLNVLKEDGDFIEKILPELLGSILLSSDPAEMLKALREDRNLFKKIPVAHLTQILASSDSTDVRAISDLLKNDKITPKLLEQILSSSDFVTILQALEKPALLNNENLTPELLTKILLGPNAGNVLNFFLKNPQYLERPDLLDGYKTIYNRLNGEVSKDFESRIFPYLLARANQTESKSTGPFINLSRLIKNPDASKWNILPMREGNISDQDWQKLRLDLEARIHSLFPGNEHLEQLTNALKWFDAMPSTRDAQVAMQMVRKRVASIVDFIKSQEVNPDILGHDALVNEGVEIAKELVKILAEGGIACADRAAIALEEAEMHAKAFGSNSEFMMNIIVNDFKRNIISAKFVNPNEKESLEDQLYHINLLNKSLGLESNIVGMRYATHATRTPLDEAMRISYEALNEENLIGFAQDHPLMQAQLRGDAKALEEFENLMNDPKKGLGSPSMDINLDTSLDLEDNPAEYGKRILFLMAQAPSVEALGQLKNRFEGDYFIRDSLYKNNPEEAKKLDDLLYVQLEKMMNNFKTEKTIMLLREKGFLSDTVDYNLPDDAYWQA